jgi:phosphoribosylamine--glycine ligase
MRDVIMPTVQGMAAEGHPYTGFLYAGLMIDASGAPKVIEFNCRFGDPETQPIMMRLQSSLVALVEAGLAQQLPNEAQWDSRPAVGVVMAAGNYPNDVRKGDAISGLDVQHPQSKVFHAGTTLNSEGQVVTNGGRVLCVTALGNNVSEAQQRAYQHLQHISWADEYHRTDIGYRAIAREQQAQQQQ